MRKKESAEDVDDGANPDRYNRLGVDEQESKEIQEILSLECTQLQSMSINTRTHAHTHATHTES